MQANNWLLFHCQHRVNWLMCGNISPWTIKRIRGCEDILCDVIIINTLQLKQIHCGYSTAYCFILSSFAWIWQLHTEQTGDFGIRHNVLIISLIGLCQCSSSATAMYSIGFVCRNWRFCLAPNTIIKAITNCSSLVSPESQWRDMLI